MKILNRYIIRTIFQTTMLVLLVLLGIDFFIQLVEEFSDVGKGHYHILQAFFYVLLTLPRDIYRLFPMAGLIGGLMGLGVLASHSELVAMRVATLSITQISKAVLIAILVMVVVVTLLGELIAPYALHFADVQKTLAKSGGQAVLTRKGLWFREKDYFIHLGKVNTPNDLEKITRYHFDHQHRLTDVSQAGRAYYLNQQWHVHDVHESFINEEGVTTHDRLNAIWQMSLNPSVLETSQEEPEEMSLSRLLTMMRYKKANYSEYADYALPFWQRLFQPIATCMMILLAIPFIFGPLRSATAGLRLIVGVMVGFSFYIINKFFGPFSVVFQMPPLLAAMLPTMLFGILVLILMSRLRRI